MRFLAAPVAKFTSFKAAYATYVSDMQNVADVREAAKLSRLSHLSGQYCSDKFIWVNHLKSSISATQHNTMNFYKESDE